MGGADSVVEFLSLGNYPLFFKPRYEANQYQGKTPPLPLLHPPHVLLLQLVLGKFHYNYPKLLDAWKERMAR